MPKAQPLHKYMKHMEDFKQGWKEESWSDKKFGPVCPKCKLRKGVFMVGARSEGGRNSVCKCD